MKIGAVVTIFKSDWKSIYQPLLNQDFDHFEILPENQDAYTIQELKDYFERKELILHAPFAQANLVAPSQHIREASYTYLSEVLTPLVKHFHPNVITTHIGKIGSFYESAILDEFIKLRKKFLTITFENLPESSTFWSESYPYNDIQLDYILNTTHAPLTFDVGHWGRQGFDVYSFLQKYGGSIRNIHLHDFKKGKDHLPFGKGDLDLPKFLSILKKSNYHYYLTLELGFENTAVTIESYQIVKKLLV
ncbi:sugar phosphate isomerase/epimerase [Candidatus Roizmanbacteria bacterium]|nr:sugar phosphate isomerase/epimerase [Candidatus Roizmanbacteria bacterium]